MNGLVDIHCHLLPGIDDGPADLEGSVALARAARNSGTTTLVATPHLRADFPDVNVNELADRCQVVREALASEQVRIQIVGGAEVSLVWALEASDRDLKLASFGQSGADLLIETPTTASGLEQLLFELRTDGYRITLAHPERNEEFQRDPSKLEALTHQGVILQINASSLISRKGAPHGRLARHLCEEGLAHVIASDGHRADSWRPVTAMAEGAAAAARIVGEEQAHWMASQAPLMLLAGRELPPRPESGPGKRLGRLLRRG